jgi:hypothetical protein
MNGATLTVRMRAMMAAEGDYLDNELTFRYSLTTFGAPYSCEVNIPLTYQPL